MKVSKTGLKMRLMALGQILLFFALVGCSGAWHLRQAVKKGVIIKSDTVYQEKTVIVPGDSTTIFVPVTRLKDSLVTVYQDRIKIQYRTVHDTLRFQVECPPDSIIVRVPVAVNTEIDCPPPNGMWRTVTFVLIGLLALLVYVVARR